MKSHHNILVVVKEIRLNKMFFITSYFILGVLWGGDGGGGGGSSPLSTLPCVGHRLVHRQSGP